jgi:hypothetical protein
MKRNLLKDIFVTLINHTVDNEQINFDGKPYFISAGSSFNTPKLPVVPGSGIPFSIQIDGFSEPLWLRFDIDPKGEYFKTTVIELNGWYVREKPGVNEINFLYVNEQTQTIHRFSIAAIGILIVGTTDLPELVFTS